MKTFAPVPKIYFLLFVLFVEYMNYVNCLNMWTSLEQKQAGNKTPSKKCVSPCRIFHTWCKNEGKCREKGRDCTWYCECPSNCEGFFCEKKVEKLTAIDAGQTIEVKVSTEKEKMKPVSAFDKSKLAQALAGIFSKEKKTDEEKKTVFPETIERVGNTIKTKENVTTKVILNCPPSELYKKAPLTEKPINQTTTNIPNNQSHSNAVTKSIMNVSESIINMTTSTYPATEQSRPQPTEKPIVSSSFSDTTITKITTKIPSITQHQKTSPMPQSSITHAQIHETNLNLNVKSSTANMNNLTIKQTTEIPTGFKQDKIKSYETTSQMKLRTSFNQSQSVLATKAKTTSISDEISTSTKPTTLSNVTQLSTLSTIKTIEKSVSQYKTPSQSNKRTITLDTMVLSTAKSAMPDHIKQSKETLLLTKRTEHNSTSEIPSTLTILTSTSSPVQKYEKDSKAPVENSLYVQNTNEINIAGKPDLMQIIEKAIEVEFITTTEKATTESSLHDKIITTASSNETKNNNVLLTQKVHISTMPTTKQIKKQVTETTGNDMNDMDTTPFQHSSSTSATPTTSNQNNFTERKNEKKISIKHKTSAKQPVSDVSPKQTVASSVLYEQKTTNIPLTQKVASSYHNLNTGDPNNSSNSKITRHEIYSSQDADKFKINSTISTVERPNNDQKTTQFSGTREKTDIETTTIKTTTMDGVITSQINKTPGVRKSSKVDKIIPSESSNDIEIQKMQISTDSVSGKYKSKPDTLSTNEINRLSPANVQVLNMSQVITVSHDLLKTTKLDTSTAQTVMSNKITPEQQNSTKLVKNVRGSTLSPTSTERDTQIISTVTTEGSVSTPLTAAHSNTDIEKSTKEIRDINSVRTSTFSTKSSLFNDREKTTFDTIISKDRSEILKSTVKDISPTSTPRSLETTTQISSNQSTTTTTKTTTALSTPEHFTGDTAVSSSSNHPTKTSSYTSQGVTESIVTNPGNRKQISTLNATSNTGNLLTGTTAKHFLTTEIFNSSSKVSLSTPESNFKNEYPNITTMETTTQANHLDGNKPTTESVLYSADIGESKLSFAKNILDNKLDILKKSKVKNEILNNRLSETVKDLKFDLLKMGLRDKGLPSDIDNIL